MDGLYHTLATEFGRLPGPGGVVVLLRVLGAALLCGLIGLERELSDHAAGLRTNMLVGVASAVFAVIGLSLIDQLEGDTIRIDPIRLIEAVTSGVAFLAAGLIVLSRGQVRGLTTGATVWLSGAVGLAVGIGQWMLALLGALVGLAVLIGLARLECRLGISGKKAIEEPAE